MATALETARDALEAVIAAQTAAWQADGCPPTFSVDGESYDWNNWLAGKTAALKELNGLIQKRAGPFIVRSRGRL
mgnify:CR=1 FL=1